MAPTAPPQMQPYTRSKHRFIPGPAIFPMAETLLQSLVLSDSLERSKLPRNPPLSIHMFYLILRTTAARLLLISLSP